MMTERTDSVSSTRLWIGDAFRETKKQQLSVLYKVLLTEPMFQADIASSGACGIFQIYLYFFWSFSQYLDSLNLLVNSKLIDTN